MNEEEHFAQMLNGMIKPSDFLNSLKNVPVQETLQQLGTKGKGLWEMMHETKAPVYIAGVDPFQPDDKVVVEEKPKGIYKQIPKRTYKIPEHIKAGAFKLPAVVQEPPKAPEPPVEQKFFLHDEMIDWLKKNLTIQLYHYNGTPNTSNNGHTLSFTVMQEVVIQVAGVDIAANCLPIPDYDLTQTLRSMDQKIKDLEHEITVLKDQNAM